MGVLTEKTKAGRNVVDPSDGRSTHARKKKQIKNSLVSVMDHKPNVAEEALLDVATGMIMSAQHISARVFKGSAKASGESMRLYRALRQLFFDLGIDLNAANQALADDEPRLVRRQKNQHAAMATGRFVQRLEQRFLEDDDAWRSIFSAFAKAEHGEPEIGQKIELEDGRIVEVCGGEKLVLVSKPAVKRARKKVRK